MIGKIGRVEMDNPSKRPLAPGELRLVQRFINTNDREEGSDLFDDSAAIRAWMLEQGLDTPAAITERERKRVVEFREALRTLAAANNGRPPEQTAIDVLNRFAAGLAVRVRLDAGAHAQLEARGQGIDAMLARLLAIVTAAQFSGSWQRLKACSRDKCQWVFYDRSRNRSGAWCEMGICGSREKAMAYYRRRRGGGRTSPQAVARDAHSARKVARGSDPPAKSRS
jgi:predicted RNA-binding Zn ribbon-like protein